jgi:hypothetical protein
VTNYYELKANALARENEQLKEQLAAARAGGVPVLEDDAEPVTGEWLLSIGFKDEDLSLRIRSPWADDWHNHLRHTQASMRKSDCLWSANGIGIAHQQTRGHVRRLLAALGISLSPPEAGR